MASCSEDKSVTIWEELPSTTKRNRSTFEQHLEITNTNGISNSNGITNGKSGKSSQFSSSNRYRMWQERAKLVESSTSIVDIQFAPKHLGLQLASCSVSGHIRIYAPTDISNLSSWSLQNDFIAYDKQASCLSWNPNQFEEPMIAVACGDNKVRIFSYNDNLRKWGVINILEGHKNTIHSISWAPSLGRSIHLIATGSKDGTVRVWKLEPKNENNTTSDETRFSVFPIASLEDHIQEVWKVEWNATGTILYTSGDDQTIRSYKVVRGSQGLQMELQNVEKPKS